MLEWKVSRHRLLFDALMKRAGAIRRRRTAGVKPGCIKRQALAWIVPMTRKREILWFRATRAGGLVNDTGCGLTSGNRRSNVRQNGLSFSCLSPSKVRIHNPGAPMAAHQLRNDGVRLAHDRTPRV
jgi:hypothetical protein